MMAYVKPKLVALINIYLFFFIYLFIFFLYDCITVKYITFTGPCIVIIL